MPLWSHHLSVPCLSRSSHCFSDTDTSGQGRVRGRKSVEHGPGTPEGTLGVQGTVWA